MTGIYFWRCLVNEKYYIGSAVDIGQRISGEFSNIKNNGRLCNPLLKSDFIQYGEDVFEVGILERCKEEDLLNRESFWLNEIKNKYNNKKISIKIELQEKDIKRFWSYVNKLGENDCWEWTGYKPDRGYGKMTVRKDGQKNCFNTHRISYFIEHPNDNQNVIIRHTCDNTSCVNPKHLVIGSSSDNSKDIRERNNAGNNSQIMTWEDVNFIREVYLQDIFIHRDELSKIFTENRQKTVSPANLLNICQNKLWKDKTYNPPPRYFDKIKDEIKSKFYNSPEVSFAEIKKYVFETYGIRTDIYSIGKVLEGRQSKFTRNKIKDQIIIDNVVQLHSNGLSNKDIVKYLSDRSVVVSKNTVYRILKQQKSENI